MTPEQMAERLAEWARSRLMRVDGEAIVVNDRRVDCVEPEGSRRTWALWEGGRQCGHVRMRATHTPYTVSRVPPWGPTRTEIVSVDAWTVEASDRTRAMLGLDDAPEAGQTGSHG